MKGLPEKVTTIGFVLALCLLAGTGAASYVGVRQLAESRAWVEHTYQVLEAIDRTSDQIRFAENGRRGYIITRTSNYLAVYQNAVVRVQQELKAVRQLTQDNSQQQQRLDQLEPLIKARLDLMDRSIAFYQQNPDELVAQSTFTNRGVQLQQQLQAIVTEINDEERRLLEQRSLKATAVIYHLILLIGVGCSLSVGLLIGIYLLLRRQVSITKKLSEEAVKLESQLSQARIANLLENVTDAFVALDRDWRYTHVNRRAGQLFGREPEDLIGKNIWEEFPEGVGQTFYYAYYQAVAEQRMIQIEEYYPPWDRWFENRIYPSEEGISIFFQEITQRKRAEEALRQSQMQLQLILDYSPAVIYVKDLEGRFILVNRRFEQLVKRDRDQIIGQTDYDLFPRVLSDIFRENDRLVISTQTAIELEEVAPGEMGTLRTYLSVKFPLVQMDGTLYATCGFSMDITDRKQAEAALQQAKTDLEVKVQERTAALQQLNEELQRSNQELEQFAYIVSHDLQEPLRAVRSYTQLLAEDYPIAESDAMVHEYMLHITEGAERMQQLIQDLLSYSRMGSNPLILTAFDCNEVLRQVIQNLQVAIAESQANITAESLPVITADRTQLIQLLQNLISNAIKFRREIPLQIHITVHSAADEWRFVVQDNGIGIKPQYLERIFVIFKRLHTRQEFPGTGIGLAIAKRIVERHGGRIWANSEPGQGTAFYFTLPKQVKGQK
jgi:PAS domain S-box-containing protein